LLEWSGIGNNGTFLLAQFIAPVAQDDADELCRFQRLL
jgi:hypothetical protein